MKKMLAGVAFCSCVLSLAMNGQAKDGKQSHWYYCNGTETQNSKNTYYSTTFNSPADSKALFRNFGDYVRQHYDLPANGLTGVCYGARPYLADTFANVEYQRTQDMTQANKRRQNVIPTGWNGQ